MHPIFWPLGPRGPGNSFRTPFAALCPKGPNDPYSEIVFVSQERVSGFPEKRADLRGSPGTSGEVWGTSGKSGELPGKFGKIPGNLWLAVKFHSERTFRGSRGKTSREVRGTSREVRGLSRSSGSLTPSQRLAKFVSNL